MSTRCPDCSGSGWACTLSGHVFGRCRMCKGEGSIDFEEAS